LLAAQVVLAPLRRYSFAMEPTASTTEACEQDAEGDRVRLLRAIAEGLADDVAGRTMDTRTLKESLERELGPIAWP
jgi:hypothetical protein